MLIAFWLGIIWLMYGDHEEPEFSTHGTNKEFAKLMLKQDDRNGSCPYVCEVADSIMMSLSDENETVTSIGELHAKCGVAQFLITDCWDGRKYGTACLPRNKMLKSKILDFSNNYCTESYYENEYNVSQKSCFSRWIQNGRQCSKEYINLVTLSMKQNSTTTNNNSKIQLICCQFVEFLKCAMKGVAVECSIEIEDFIERFLFKLTDQTMVEKCRAYKFKSVYNSECKNRN